MKSSNEKSAVKVGGGAGAGAVVKRKRASKSKAAASPVAVQLPTASPVAVDLVAASPVAVPTVSPVAVDLFAIARRRWWATAAAVPAAAAAKVKAAGAAVLAAWQASRLAFWASSPVAVQLPTVSPVAVQLPTVAGGGLVSVAAALVGFAVDPARRASAVECQSVAQLLRGCERPAGPLLQALQTANDMALCQGFARKLNKKMVGDGRESLLVRDGAAGVGYFAWLITMEDAVSDAQAALAKWRAGYGVTRDNSGADVLTVGDELGNCGGRLWVKTCFPSVRVKKGESVSDAFKRVQAKESVSDAVAGYLSPGFALGVVRRQAKDLSAFIAWRALVDSVKDDNLGNSESIQLAAKDFYAWAELDTNLGDMGRHIWAGITAEHRQAARLARVENVFDTLAAGRGKRKAFIAKAKHSTLLMLNGTGADAACLAAGFKGSKGSKGSGSTSPSNRLAFGLRRCGVPVCAKRGNLSEYQMIWAAVFDAKGKDTGKGHFVVAKDMFQAAQKRGGAAVDLLTLLSFPGVSRECSPVAAALPVAGRVCGSRCLLAARVRAGVRSGAALMRSAARKSVLGGLRFDWSQLSASARFAALPIGQRVGLAWRAVNGSPVPRRGQLVPFVAVRPVAAASESVEVSSLPILPAQVRAIVAAFNRRKLQGVLRSTPLILNNYSGHVEAWRRMQAQARVDLAALVRRQAIGAEFNS